MTEWLAESQDVMNFGYDAVEDTGRRKSPKRVVTSEDKQLDKTARKVLQSTTRDMRRNFVITRWAINKHIDFVVDHAFQPDSGDAAFDKTLSEFYDMASRAENFDISGRYSLSKYCRLAEAARIVDGDFFSIRKRGGYLQAIESDRIRDPENDTQAPWIPDDGSWVHGIQTDKVGRHKSYAIHRRTTGQGSGFEFEGTVSARKVIPLGFYDRFDQIRGVSPLAAALNTLKDLHESYDYALAKAKVAQLFSMVITREADWALNEDEEDGDQTPSRKISFNKGPQVLDLDQGEDAKMLSTNTPGEETAAFWQEMTSLVLKALNIPYSFFQENHTNFFGSRSALVLYLRAVEKDREDQIAFRNDWLCWRLKTGVLKGEIVMPASFECDPKNWSFIPTGIQYWDPVKEVKADIMAINAGLTTRQRVTKERFGIDWASKIYEPLLIESKKMKVLNPEPELPKPAQKEPK